MYFSIILGEPFLDATQTKINYEKHCISAKSFLYNEDNKSKKVQLQLISSSGNAELINEDEIQIGQSSAIFSLKINNDYDFL